ncbi:unnamed protein product [Dicrocoelium dendriticum]|nr:unnamed protein product [Dicrocoelium dendriticum]
MNHLGWASVYDTFLFSCRVCLGLSAFESRCRISEIGDSLLTVYRPNPTMGTPLGLHVLLHTDLSFSFHSVKSSTSNWKSSLETQFGGHW